MLQFLEPLPPAPEGIQANHASRDGRNEPTERAAENAAVLPRAKRPEGLGEPSKPAIAQLRTKTDRVKPDVVTLVFGTHQATDAQCIHFTCASIVARKRPMFASKIVACIFRFQLCVLARAVLYVSE